MTNGEWLIRANTMLSGNCQQYLQRRFSSRSLSDCGNFRAHYLHQTNNLTERHQTTMTQAAKRAYPWTTTLKDRHITLRLMQATDRDAVLSFAQALPADDLLFLPVDITHPKVIDGWVRSLQSGRTMTIVAESAGRLLGMGTLVRSETMWARHLGNIRLLVGTDARGIGLGHVLANEIFALAEDAGLQKVVAQMAAEERGAIAVFERLGFKAEALLADYVMDRDGRTHDLIVMSHDVTGLNE